MAKKQIDTRELPVGQEQEYEVPMTGHVHRSDFTDEVEIIDTPRWKDKAKELAFMEETVEVVITADSNPHAEQFIHLANGGTNQFLERGVPNVIKRKFVEVLARAKQEVITTPQFIDAGGNQATKIVRTPGLRYPFRVLKDRNPDGPVWLERVLAEA